MLGMIWAQARDGVIGEAGDMPWRLPEDMQRFKAITMGHPVVMGRRTWESFPERFRPLPGRDNIVITSDRDYVAPGATIVRSLDEALEAARAIDDEVWIVGGGRVYRDAMDRADRLEITDIDLGASGDTTAPESGCVMARGRARSVRGVARQPHGTPLRVPHPRARRSLSASAASLRRARARATVQRRVAVSASRPAALPGDDAGPAGRDRPGVAAELVKSRSSVRPIPSNSRR